MSDSFTAQVGLDHIAEAYSKANSSKAKAIIHAARINAAANYLDFFVKPPSSTGHMLEGTLKVAETALLFLQREFDTALKESMKAEERV